MRIVTWNVHGALKESPLWDLLLELQPDVALLQEIGSIPNSVTDGFDHLTRQAVGKTGRPQRFRTGVFVRGRLHFRPNTTGLLASLNSSGEISLAAGCNWSIGDRSA
jgi:hypothetical protein